MQTEAHDHTTTELVHELSQEVRAISELGTTKLVVWVLTAALLLWALRALLRGLGRVSAHFGADRGRRFARVARAVQLLFLLLVMLELLQSAARVAPVWVAALVVFVLAPMALWSSGIVHDLAGGALAQLRLRLSEGDYVRIGQTRGVLTRVGIIHLDVRDEAGTLHRIPNRTLAASELETCDYRRAVPVVVELTTQRPLSHEELERLSDGTATSPFRAPGTRVSVERLGAPERVRVQFFVWSQRAVSPARRRLERALTKLAPARSE